jgi:tetratricopeptide (TPR) repeat protein
MTSKKRLLLSVISFFTLVAIYGAASAQSSKEVEGRAAEQAGRLREALAHYMAALQPAPEGGADDLRLRETIIKLVQKLSPPPAIPEEARRFSVRGQIAIKEAKSPADFDEAANEFGKALRVAPWWADGYFNQGVALEKAGKYNEAIRSLKFYLFSAPGAPDAEKIKEQIYALEYRQEKTGKEAATKRQEQETKSRVEAEKKARTSSLGGYWRDSIGHRYLFKVDGNSFTVTRVMACWRLPSQEWGTCPDLRPDNTLFVFGTINNDRLSGYGVNPHNHRTRQVINPDGSSLACPVAAGNYPITRSEISADGTRLKISWSGDTPENPNCPPMELGGNYRREQ